MVVVTGTSYATTYGLVWEFATVVYREEPAVSLAVRSSANALFVTWPTNATGFTLQSTQDLTAPGSWRDVTNSPAVTGGQFTVTNAMTTTSQFFRLKKP